MIQGAARHADVSVGYIRSPLQDDGSLGVVFALRSRSGTKAVQPSAGREAAARVGNSRPLPDGKPKRQRRQCKLSHHGQILYSAGPLTGSPNEGPPASLILLPGL